MIISDSKHDEIREIAYEILDARTDAEFNDACRAMAAAIAETSLRPAEG